MKWLPRQVHIDGPYICLCTDEAGFLKAAKKLNWQPGGPWVTPGAGASTWILESDKKLVAIVCFNPQTESTPVEKAALLVHEAVHIWKAHLRNIGEDAPGEEIEAYGVQHISQNLMSAYAESLK